MVLEVEISAVGSLRGGETKSDFEGDLWIRAVGCYGLVGFCRQFGDEESRENAAVEGEFENFWTGE